MTTTSPISFHAPGPGDWMLDTTHHGRRPVTVFMQPVYEHAFDVGMTALFEKYGLPLARARTGWVNGCLYIRMVAIGEPDKPKPPPPLWLMKAIVRLHPQLRRRAKTAAIALEQRQWRRDVDQWFDHDRSAVIERHRVLQDIELEPLSDKQLVAHLEAARDNLLQCAADGFAYHGGDIISIGMFAAACQTWGIDASTAATFLAGASPATTEVRHLLQPVADACGQLTSSPTSVDAVRSLGPQCATAVDNWLADHQWRLLTSDDLDSPTLAERPDLQLKALLASIAAPSPTTVGDPEQIRARVPATDHARFDDLLAEARYGMRLRDDHVGVRWNWPAGLIRRALLEVGRRLVARDVVGDAQLAVELAHAEVTDALAGAGLTGDELASRRAFRDAVELAGPPRHFASGIDAEPPVDAFPNAMATMTRAALASIAAMEGPGEQPLLHGTGVGDSTVRGRACVARSHLDAFDQLEPGDVLITSFTSPSYNALFPLVSALVTEEGGPLSHGAIMAREFAIPAVVGAAGAMAIAHGSQVEVDARSGTIVQLDLRD